MQLTGYKQVVAADVGVGKPIRAVESDAFRSNDELFEKILQAMLASPLVPNGADGAVTVPATPPEKFIQAVTISMTANVTTLAQVPLIWFAREKITVNQTIDANGKGASPFVPAAGGNPAVPPQDGDFGGSGGSGTGAGNNGKSCLMPVTGVVMAAGALPGAAGVQISAEWASRALSCLGFCKGGAAGGGANGGAGGGIVVLCAPEIEMATTGRIEARGNPGTATNSGGGGGGLIILIARRFSGSGIVEAGASQNVFFNGGLAHGANAAAQQSRKGGDGRVLKIEIR